MRRARPGPLVRASAVAALAGALAVGLLACGETSLDERREQDLRRQERQLGHLPPSLRPPTESVKITRLLDTLAQSGHTFVRNGRDHDSHEGAEHLRVKLTRAGDRVSSAEDFIAVVATRSAITQIPYHLRLADGTELELRAWLLDRLREQQTPSPRAHPIQVGEGAPLPAPAPGRPVDIEYALHMIEQSRAIFLSPGKGGEPVVYTAAEFARMLRRKSTWLGPDLQELEPWLDEIASRSFKSDEPYRVRLEDGSDTELRPWLDIRLEAARAAAAELP